MFDKRQKIHLNNNRFLWLELLSIPCFAEPFNGKDGKRIESEKRQRKIFDREEFRERERGGGR